MKSVRIIYILFLFLVAINIANSMVGRNAISYFERNATDSLYFAQTATTSDIEIAKRNIDAYNKALEKNSVLTQEDLKRLSFSYATLSNATKASLYAEKYIKQGHNINILDAAVFNSIKGTSAYENLYERYNPKFSFLFLVYCSIGVIGIFIAIVLNLKKDTDRIANLLISLFILFTSLFIVHVCIFISNVQFIFPHSLYMTITFNFLYGPLLYFYFKRITKKHIFKLKDLLHLAPFVFFAFYFLKYYVLSGNEKLHILLNREESFDPILNFVVLFKIASLVGYGFLIFKMYLNTKKKRSVKHDEVVIRWQRNIVILNSFYVLSHVLYVFMIVGLLQMYFLIHVQNVLMSTIILYIGYIAFVQPKVFTENFRFGNFGFLKYKKSGLTHNYSKELKEDLLQLFIDEKIYQESDITLAKLSERLGTTRHNTSQVINEHFNMNFFRLINKFRIEEALRLLKNGDHNKLHIIDIVYKIGFNNKVTFNKAFKEETDLTPTQYLKFIENNLAESA